MKNRGHKALAQDLSDAAARLLCPVLAESHTIEAVFAVPPSVQGRRFRGFSLPQMMESAILRETGWSVLDPKLRRAYRGAVKSSKNLSRSQRLSRRDSVVDSSGESENRGTLLLVDDVVTTGATLARCVERARLQGFSKVICFALAEHRPES